VWARQIRQLRLTIPRSSALFVSCAPGAFLGGSRGGGAGMPPPSYAQHSAPGVARGRRVWGSAPKFFWAVFAIFSGLLKIILVLGIRVLVSTEYLKTLYILYSEW
jgi:hypothetical protein